MVPILVSSRSYASPQRQDQVLELHGTFLFFRVPPRPVTVLISSRWWVFDRYVALVLVRGLALTLGLSKRLALGLSLRPALALALRLALASIPIGDRCTGVRCQLPILAHVESNRHGQCSAGGVHIVNSIVQGRIIWRSYVPYKQSHGFFGCRLQINLE